MARCTGFRFCRFCRTLQSVLVRVLDFVLGSGKPLKSFKQGTDNDLLLFCTECFEHSRQGRGRPVRQLS